VRNDKTGYSQNKSLHKKASGKEALGFHYHFCAQHTHCHSAIHHYPPKYHRPGVAAAHRPYPYFYNNGNGYSVGIKVA
jgi:hypothetical protein